MEPYECDECGGNGEYTYEDFGDVIEVTCLACSHVGEIIAEACCVCGGSATRRFGPNLVCDECEDPARVEEEPPEEPRDDYGYDGLPLLVS